MICLSYQFYHKKTNKKTRESNQNNLLILHWDWRE